MAHKRVSTRHYLIVWGSLMGLALASFLLSFLQLGSASTLIALAIGVVKAVLIAAFFMHLVEQPAISRFAFVFGIGLALLLLIMVGLDVVTRDTTGVGLRQPGMISGPGPVPNKGVTR